MERTIYKVIKNNEVVLETTNQEEAVLFYEDVSGDSIELFLQKQASVIVVVEDKERT